MPKWTVLILIVVGLSACRHAAPAGNDPLAIDMVPIAGGTFRMGDVIDLAHPDALPLHEVHVGAFRIARYETTFSQYDAFAHATGRPLPDDDGDGRGKRAVVHVTWNEASAFCTYHGYRLPTEAEWEFAARSRGLPQVYPGTDDPDSLRHYAFYGGNSPGFTMPVGLKKPNAIGLYDMSGNAAEWVGAYYEKYPSNGAKPVFKDITTPGFRITRGGSFVPSDMPPGPLSTARTYWRAGTLDDIESFSIGFRCAD